MSILSLSFSTKVFSLFFKNILYWKWFTKFFKEKFILNISLSFLHFIILIILLISIL
jgi:hypothetical protein